MTAKKIIPIHPNRRRALSAAILILNLLSASLCLAAHTLTVSAQGTPVPLQIITRTPTTANTVVPSAAPVVRGLTPTIAISAARIRPNDNNKAGINVRSSPEVAEGNKIGTITQDKWYPVIVRLPVNETEAWLQIVYEASPTGKAWVYQGVVEIQGVDDPNRIPTPKPESAATLDPKQRADAATAGFLTRTPGAADTATVIARSATGVFTPTAGAQTPGQVALQITFTYPAPRVEATLPPRNPAALAQGGLPPVIPIVLLGGLGIFGLLVSFLRRF